MKALNLALLALVLPFAGAFADQGVNHPCKQIVSACESAGFVKGGHKTGKGLFKDCVKPIKEGQTVSGVTIDKSVVNACVAKRPAKNS